MSENNSIESIDKTILTEETKFQLREMVLIKNYFTKRLIKEKNVVKN